MKNLSNKEWSWIVIFLSIAACIGITFVPPIAQDPVYHSFADARRIKDIPGFWNVISNIPFFIVGIAGIILVIRNRYPLSLNYLFFFIGILLTSFGSAWYHLDPDNDTLIWDRLPMTIAFMSFFSIIIGEFVSRKSGEWLLFPLLFVGAFSVLYWYEGEQHGQGDLRLYFLVQFLPMLLIPLIMLVFKPSANGIRYIWLMLLSYVIAKVFEKYDAEVYAYFLSGHTIKHLFAAAAPLFLLIRLQKRSLPR